MRGHIRPGRVQGTWYLRVELTRATDGRRRQRRETFWGTKAEAQSRLRHLLRQAETGGLDAARITFKDLCAHWLMATEHRVGTKTQARYASISRLYLVPSLGSMRVGTLRPAHIEAALGSWIGGKRNDRQDGRLSPRSVKHILDTLKSVFRWAVRMGLASGNPADAVTGPRVERREMQTVNVEGFGKLLEVACETDLNAAIIVAAGTGLRRGELLGLRWSDVDFSTAVLTVNRSVETVNGELRTKPPKTARSARQHPMAAFVVEALRARKAQQAERRLLLGMGRDDDGWVFTRADESPWEPGAFSLHFARLIKRHKLPHLRFHDLRHSYATFARAANVDLKTLSELMGHSTISVTANTYMHAVGELQRDASARLDTVLASTVKRSQASVEEEAPRTSVPQRCHVERSAIKKARRYGSFVVAPTGIEPVFPP